MGCGVGGGGGGAPHASWCLASRHPRFPRPPPPRIHLATVPQTEFKKTGTSKPDFQVITGSIYALDHVLNSFCDVLQEASAADSAALYKCDCAPTKLPSCIHAQVSSKNVSIFRCLCHYLLVVVCTVHPCMCARRFIFEYSVTIPEDLTRFAVPEVRCTLTLSHARLLHVRTRAAVLGSSLPSQREVFGAWVWERRSFPCAWGRGRCTR